MITLKKSMIILYIVNRTCCDEMTKEGYTCINKFPPCGKFIDHRQVITQVHDANWKPCEITQKTNLEFIFRMDMVGAY